MTDQGFVVTRPGRGGLSDEEATQRLERFGYNEMAARKRQSVVVEFLLHFRNPLIIILLIASVISIFLSELADAVIILVIIVISVFIDFIQEHRAGKAIELLRAKITTTATVIREESRIELPIRYLVPGDLITLSAGDIVPADSVVLSARDFFLNQSALTGEAYPVEKVALPLETAIASAEKRNYLYLGTSVVSGTANAVVVKTGPNTEYGQIAESLIHQPPVTEFDRGLRRFGYLITRLILFLVLFVFAVNALFRHGILESLLFAVALAVGLTPELLPMILSVNLSRGAMAMSRNGAIVKYLGAIQNFGSMDILCTDKTGTLTENRITMVLHIDGTGKTSEEVLLLSYLNSSFQTGLKSPLDEAILRYQQKDIGEFQKVDEIPFDFSRKRVSVVVEQGPGRTLIAKGAPEEILRICATWTRDGISTPLTEEWLQKIHEEYYSLSREGFRVLGVAYRTPDRITQVYSKEDEHDMTFAGFVAFIDPPKESARESLQIMQNTGVCFKILTGDNELVTRKTCELLGYKVEGVLTGPEIADLDDDALQRIVEKANIFTRVTPAQKNRIILALKNNGHVVGFLGDGINDAPSLRAADIGISVDNAVDIARESADIILLEKDLRVLEEGILEGRKTFGNTMKYIMMGASSNFGNMFSVAVASLFLPFLPMLPTQILLNNLLYDLSQSTIPTDTVDRDYILKPKRWDIGFIRKFIFVFGPISSIFDFLTFFIMLVVLNATEPLFQTAWFIESLLTQILIIFVIRTRKIPFFRSRPGSYLVASCGIIIGIAFILPFTPLGPLFGFVIPPTIFYLYLIILVIGYLIMVEMVKGWFYRRYAF
jgi:Mg2+-importing ATPase